MFFLMLQYNIVIIFQTNQNFNDYLQTVDKIHN